MRLPNFTLSRFLIGLQDIPVAIYDYGGWRYRLDNWQGGI